MEKAKRRRSTVVFVQHHAAPAGATGDTWDNAPAWINHGDETLWDKATVLSKLEPDEKGGEWDFEVQLEGSGEIKKLKSLSADKNNLEFAHVKRRDVGLNGPDIDDMTSLLYLNEPELLECLRQRFERKVIYTSIGPILLAVNPFERLPIYTNDILEKYYDDGSGVAAAVHPHVFQVANRAYNKMFVDKFQPDDRENQAILVNGESGAGKTESTKHVLHFLAVVSSNVASQLMLGESTQDIENQILATNPILEAFGNAKTTRNNNSSRFGKFIELLYTADGYIEGAVMRTYLLETMRVPGQGKGERNYHIFYNVHAGLPASVRADYGLTDLTNFHYTNQSGEMNRHDGESDSDNYAELREALSTLGISEPMQEAMDKIVVAILHIGNMTFVDSNKAGEDAAQFSDASRDTIRYICQLLAIDSDVLLSAVARRSVQVVGNLIEKTLNSEGALHARDTLAKFLYSNLFAWVVAKMNSVLSGRISPEEAASFIGVLDIFGFEHFAKNSFEQLCINYTNEKLQDHFNYSVFKSEQEVYKEEGLKWTFVSYPDNSARLTLLEHPTVGVLAICNEVLKLPKSNDEKFAQMLYQKCGDHDYFRATRAEKGKHEFTILHYACPVTYQSTGFLDKNRTESPKELYDALKASTNPVMLEMAGDLADKAPVDKSVSPNSPHGRAPMNKQGSAKFSVPGRFSGSHTQDAKPRPQRQTIGKKVTSLAALFQGQLTDLVTKIRSTRSHFVCCIKPNKSMKPSVFDRQMCTDQLRCGGSLGAIQVFKAGFSNRLSFQAFTTRFAAFSFISGTNVLTKDLLKAVDLARTTGNSMHWKSAAGRLLDIVPSSHLILCMASSESTESDVDVVADMQMGKTQIFLKAAAFEFLERMHLRTRNYAARRLQLRWKAWHFSKNRSNAGIKTTAGMIMAQNALRYFSDFRRLEAMKKVVSTIILQRRAKVFLAVQFRKWMLGCVKKLQGYVRAFLEHRREMKRRDKASRVLQGAFKSLTIRVRFLKLRAAITCLAKRYRGRSTRRKLFRQRNAEALGKWAVLRLQCYYRGNVAREAFASKRRAVIAKKFEDQMAEQKRKQEMLAILAAKLEEDPNLLGTLQGMPPPPVASQAPRVTSSMAAPVSAKAAATTSAEVKALKAEVSSLKERVGVLENENAALRAENANLKKNGVPAGVTSVAAPAPLGAPASAAPAPGTLSHSNSYVESPHSTPTRRGSDAKDLLRKRLSIHSGSSANLAKAVAEEAHDAEMTSEHPDWEKKYSDKHKRVYWRHKETGRTAWTAPTGDTRDLPRSSSSMSEIVKPVDTGDAPFEPLSAADLQICVEKLMSGWVCMRISSTNYPKERTIVVDPASQSLCWKKSSKVEGSLPLDQVRRITRGKKSKTLEKVKGIEACLCLSIHYGTHTLDLHLATENERNMMYSGLCGLLQMD